MAEEDLIFGKNRHFFGGIEPSNMKGFSVYLENGVVKVDAKLPDNTVIDGQQLCTVQGAIIRRKPTDYPKDEFDGDLVCDVTESTIFVDTTAKADGTYYYSAYPYTTQGVYNRNKVNRAVVNEPDPMAAFNAKSVYTKSTDKVHIELTVDIPDNVAGAIIRRSTTGYPLDETEGEEFLTVTQDGVYIDSNVVVGTTYYYAAFTYTSTGAFNRSELNRTSVMARKYLYFYGYDLDEDDANPATRVSYPADVDNAQFTAAKMNFTSGAFEYGGWPSKPGEMFMPRPCMLTYAGVVDHYLHPNDYTKREDGQTASSVASTAFGGNAMMEWPKIYVKRWSENGVYHFRCSDIKMEDDWECWSNYDKNNNEIDHFYTPIFFGSSVSNKLRSISGQSNYVNNTAASEISLAKANGADIWYTEVVADRFLICDLLTMMGKSTNHQAVYGSGRSKSGNKSAIDQGTMNTKGLFWGSTDETSGVKVFGMENWWGNLWRRTAGYINANGTQKVKLTRGTKDGTTVADYNTDGSGYLSISGATPAGTSGGYINTMKTMPYGRIPVTASGSGTTFEADGMWFNNGQNNYALFGGNWDNALLCGGFYVYLSTAASYAYAAVGAALSCKPLAAA